MTDSAEAGEPGWFDLAEFEAERARLGVRWGTPLCLLERTPSTNDLALAAADAAPPSGATWLAREQTAGRGRRGNRWLAPPGQGLLTSVLLDWAAPREPLRFLTLATGLAVRDAVATALGEGAAPQDLGLKWPNDVLAGRRKLAGILVESRVQAAHLRVVLGVGLNVSMEGFPAELPPATSLRLLGAGPGALRQPLLLALLLAALERSVARLLAEDGAAAVLAEVRRRDVLVGAALRVIDAQCPGRIGAPFELEGQGAGIDDDGCLLVERADGRVERLESGHVTLP